MTCFSLSYRVVQPKFNIMKQVHHLTENYFIRNLSYVSFLTPCIGCKQNLNTYLQCVYENDARRKDDDIIAPCLRNKGCQFNFIKSLYVTAASQSENFVKLHAMVMVRTTIFSFYYVYTKYPRWGVTYQTGILLETRGNFLRLFAQTGLQNFRPHDGDSDPPRKLKLRPPKN